MKFKRIEDVKASGAYIGRSVKGTAIPVFYNVDEKSCYIFLPKGSLVTEDTRAVVPTNVKGIIELASWSDVYIKLS